LGLLEHIERPPALRVGVIGCGAVGVAVCRAIDEGQVRAELAAVCDSDAARAQALIWSLKHPTRSMTLAGLIASSQLVVEATNSLAAAAIAVQALDGGCDVMLTNPVAILRKPELVSTAEVRGLAVWVVPALVPGLGEVRALMQSGSGQAALRLSIPASDADPDLLARAEESPEGVAFAGTPSEAAIAVPRYENLIAAFAAAGARGGRVEIAVDPGAEKPLLSVTTSFWSEGHGGSAAWQQPAGRAASDRTVALHTIAMLQRIVSGLKVG